MEKRIKDKHERIVSQYSAEKSKELERLATQMLKNDEESKKLKSYKSNGSFLDLF